MKKTKLFCSVLNKKFHFTQTEVFAFLCVCVFKKKIKQKNKTPNNTRIGGQDSQSRLVMIVLVLPFFQQPTDWGIHQGHETQGPFPPLSGEDLENTSHTFQENAWPMNQWDILEGIFLTTMKCLIFTEQDWE